ncbi:FadR/GntR family transcriptional regulator [Bordetella hinzii]|uniref:FadR family transcriptional regulator n=1 Tax=Bordetella hinzii TaxID=103855 RepID=A0AAN1RZ33_9BORD|nr:FadR/GntR family transcriptional regulator [Bordetella hinzii]AKQ55616.1 Putative L-lactate dehydrogenase operon regulatory protein [Bordetella hinzii]AKQ60118.1 Putative L-lactate dehydrogenase operon regulatory protein [Bordetella hinzii]AZW18796.1 FadR family transcriptional regulator [Bordetella hinzii]KCB26682.1 FCD domain protein [Bordetella hinzii CA90 BAL1384]KCB33216.1 FCD domain protein [Bordetella hinzii L60]
MATFQAVASTRLYRMIADQIASRIRAGDFEAGGRLPAERDLAEQLQVSRASVREALIALEIEGYVEVRVGTGVFVCAPREDGQYGHAQPAAHGAERTDIGPFDLLDTRLLLEPECAALAAQKASSAQIAVIRAAHEAMSLTESPSLHDQAFHGAIAAACGNAALAAAISHIWHLSTISPVFSRLETHFVTTRVWSAARDEHERILEAITERDPIRARHAMHDHLVGILARLREDFGSGPIR